MFQSQTSWRRRLGLGGLWFVLAVGHCALRPAAAHAEEPPSNAFYHEFFGRRGYSDPQVEQNLKLALDVADQAVILNTGRCVFSGSAGELLENEELIAQNLGVFHAHETYKIQCQNGIKS